MDAGFDMARTKVFNIPSVSLAIYQNICTKKATAGQWPIGVFKCEKNQAVTLSEGAASRVSLLAKAAYCSKF
jgi:hypothetical protein